MHHNLSQFFNITYNFPKTLNLLICLFALLMLIKRLFGLFYKKLNHYEVLFTKRQTYVIQNDLTTNCNYFL